MPVADGARLAHVKLKSRTPGAKGPSVTPPVARCWTPTLQLSGPGLTNETVPKPASSNHCLIVGRVPLSGGSELDSQRGAPGG
jgi:hypothetical protein